MIDSGFYRNTPGRIEEGLDTSRRMVEHIRRLVSDILYYAKERDIKPTSVDLLQFAGGVAANVEMKVRGADIRFNPQFPEASADMVFDADLMRTALYNIIDNAIEACIDSSAPIEHRIDFLVQVDRDKACFSVQDTGSGMSPQKADSIFDLFYSTKGRNGTGIGLFVTRKIIQKHGGTISVKSEPGRGSCFKVVLPRKPIRL